MRKTQIKLIKKAKKNGIEKQIDPLKIADPYVVKVAA